MTVAACPTAPCHENHVRTYLLEQLRNLPHVTTWVDEFGNLHAAYEYQSAGREPFRVVAHMDHPGFIIDRKSGAEEVRFAGGVEEKYFTGKRIVFYHDKSDEPLGWARIKKTSFSEKSKGVKLDRAIPREATFAMWDLPAARCTKKLFISPACDDLVQVSTVMALLRRLALSGARAKVQALFTRAEEIGFAGALAALKSKKKLIPIPTLSLETSQARGFASTGDGPIVRVGDRLSLFDTRITYWLVTAFHDLEKLKPKLVHQRLLMGGGTCEGSVFLQAGFPTGALCVALNHCHNMGPGTAIRAESISLRDWQGLYDFLFFLATEAKPLQTTNKALTEKFAHLEEKALIALRPG